MGLTSLNHVTVLTDDLDVTLAFYRDVLDLVPGARPPFDFPGAWLYLPGGAEALVHVVAGRPRDALRAGVIDHFAFTAHGLGAVLDRLKAHGVMHDLRRLPGNGPWQLFFHDPNGVRVELDFDASERTSGT